MPRAYGPSYGWEVHPMSKFFAIIVEDLGDGDGKLFPNSDQFFFSTIVQPPTDCEILGCVEIPEQQAKRLLVKVS